MKKMWIEVVFLLILGLTPLLWYKPGYIALGHDMGFPLAPIDHFIDRTYTWSERIGSFGSNQGEAINGLFIHGLEALLSSSGLPLVDVQKINFIFWFILPGLTMYILLRSLHPDKEDFLIRVGGSLFYMMNHFLLQAWTIAERTKFSVVAALPLIILFIINCLYKKQSIVKNGLLISLTLFFLNAGPGIPLYAGIIIASGFAILFFTFESGWKDNLFERINRSLKLGAISILSLLLLSAYWLIPLAYYSLQNFGSRVEQTGGVGNAVVWSREISSLASYMNLFRLQGIPDWGGNPEHPYASNFTNNPFLIVISFLWPFLILVALLFSRYQPRRQRILIAFFLLLFLVGIFFTAGSHYPSGIVYDFLLTNLPGFTALRTPYYKFAVILWLGYAYLVGYSLSSLFRMAKGLNFQNSVSRRLPFLIPVLFLILFSIYNYPYFTGQFFDWSKNYSTMIKVPDYIFDFKKWADNLPISSDRILMIPGLDPNTEYEIYNWRYFSLSTIPTILTNKSVITNDAYTNGKEKALIKILYSNLENRHDFSLAKYLGIGHLLLRDDFNAPINGNYLTQPLKDAVLNSPFFNKSQEFGEWTIFDPVNNDRFPLIYPATDNTYISSVSGIDLLGYLPSLNLGESFFIADKKNDKVLPLENFTRSIFEGGCSECNPSPTTFSFMLLPKPRILPQSKLLYALDTVIEENREKKITNNEQKIDFLLGLNLKKEALMASTLHRSDDLSLQVIIMKDIKANFQEATYRYSLITDPKLKSFYGERLATYKLHFLKRTKDWLSSSSWSQSIGGSTILELLSEIHLSMYDTRMPVYSSPKHLGRSYSFNVSKQGKYQIYVFGDSRIQEDLKDQKIDLVINEAKWTASPIPVSSNLFSFGDINLNSGNYSIGFPLSASRDVAINPNERSFTIFANRDDMSCKTIRINNINSISNYKLSFMYRTEMGAPTRFRIIQDTDLLRIPAKTVYKVDDFLRNENLSNKYEINFQPDKYAKYLTAEFCVNLYRFNDSRIIIDDFTVKSQSDPKVFLLSFGKTKVNKKPNISFMKIDQTRYLISVNSASEPFFLNFNQRFDPNWVLKSVKIQNIDDIFHPDLLVLERYNSKEYKKIGNNSSVTYGIGQRIGAEHFAINGYANAWLISEQGDYNFILEYEPQTILNRSLLLSAASFLVVLIILIFRSKGCSLNYYHKKLGSWEDNDV